MNLSKRFKIYRHHDHTVEEPSDIITSTDDSKEAIRLCYLHTQQDRNQGDIYYNYAIFDSLNQKVN